MCNLRVLYLYIQVRLWARFASSEDQDLPKKAENWIARFKISLTMRDIFRDILRQAPLCAIPRD